MCVVSLPKRLPAGPLFSIGAMDIDGIDTLTRLEKARRVGCGGVEGGRGGNEWCVEWVDWDGLRRMCRKRTRCMDCVRQQPLFVGVFVWIVVGGVLSSVVQL